MIYNTTPNYPEGVTERDIDRIGEPLQGGNEMNEQEKLNELDESEKIVYMWQYKMLGGFKSELMKVISRADNDNLDKLEKGFPDEVIGYRKFSRIAGWWENVENKMSEK